MSHCYIICHRGDKMRKVELRMNEQEKYEVIKELVDHNGNKNRASKKLGISRRQINRLIIIYKEKGKAGFVHGNRTKKPINALDKSISEDIILLYQTKYYDFNFNHFKEFLERRKERKEHNLLLEVKQVIILCPNPCVKSLIIDFHEHTRLIRKTYLLRNQDRGSDDSSDNYCYNKVTLLTA